MLIDAKTTIDGFEKSKKFLFSLPDSIDKELLKESPLCIKFNDLRNDVSVPFYDGKNFSTTYHYPEEISAKLISDEFAHYESLLNTEITTLCEYLKNNPLSKRAIINVWDDSQSDLSHKAECLVYLLFRKTGNGLDMHVHMRANDALSKALLNFHIFSATHRFLATCLNENVGQYLHVTDSYHIYRN